MVRQSFFHDDTRTFSDVGGGVTAVKGFYSSFRLTHGGLSLNMGITHLVFSSSMFLLLWFASCIKIAEVYFVRCILNNDLETGTCCGFPSC